MRTFLFLILSITFSWQVLSQKVGERPELDEYFVSLKAGMDTSSNAKGMENMQANFEKLTQDYPRDWRSYYWAAYGEWKKSEFTLDSNQKIKAINKSLHWLKRAEHLEENNAEIDILRAFVYYEKMRTDSEKNQAKYTSDFKYYLKKGYEGNKDNPRYFLLMGIKLLNDTLKNPNNFDKSGEYFAGTELLFSQQEKTKKHANPFWGREIAGRYLMLFEPEVLPDTQVDEEDIINQLEKDIAAKKGEKSKEEKKEEKKKEKSKKEKKSKKKDKDKKKEKKSGITVKEKKSKKKKKK